MRGPLLLALIRLLGLFGILLARLHNRVVFSDSIGRYFLLLGLDIGVHWPRVTIPDREVVRGMARFAGGQFVLALVFINAPDADVRFGLKAVGLANGTIERADRFIGLARLAIDTPFDG